MKKNYEVPTLKAQKFMTELVLDNSAVSSNNTKSAQSSLEGKVTDVQSLEL